MPKRVRPYGSAADAESAGLGRGRAGAGGELVSELASTMMMRDIAHQAAEATRALRELTSDGTGFGSLEDVRDVIASLERIGQDLPNLCEQIARILVVQREEGQIAPGSGQDPDFWVVEVVEALAAAGQAADMMTAALNQAGKTSAELRPARLKDALQHGASGPSGRVGARARGGWARGRGGAWRVAGWEGGRSEALIGSGIRLSVEVLIEHLAEHRLVRGGP
jgi:hypothetical protein